MIKVGLVLQLRGMWRGGIVYYHNLLQCYRDHQDPAVRLVVFTDQHRDLSQYQVDNLEIHRCAQLSLGGVWNGPRRRLRRFIKRRRGYDPVLLRMIERQKIDLLTHISIGAQVAVNTLPWQPDFQHKVYPEFFSTEECSGRDSEIANVALWGNILLSSRAAAEAFRRYYPELASVRSHVLHFPSLAAQSVIPQSREDLEKRYPVHQPYFFLPNQFWYHKNHRVVVDALRLTAPGIRVLCTGLMEDRRNPTYVPDLLQEVKKQGLADRFICLGELPYPTMVSLMDQCIAVLQPSLFEGWSTTVEEAKAMRKRIILSNIDVHLEQAPDRASYFAPDSPEDLAACMNQVFAEFCSATEKAFEEQRKQYRTRAAKTFGEDFSAILKSASATSGSEPSKR